MALLRYCQAMASLPTALSDTVKQSANAAVLGEVQAEWLGKRKPYTVLAAEQRATIRKYASEDGNAAAVKKFKANIEGGQLGESTVRLFKKRYFEELKKAKHSGATVPEVKSIASRKRGHPLLLVMWTPKCRHTSKAWHSCESLQQVKHKCGSRTPIRTLGMGDVSGDCKIFATCNPFQGFWLANVTALIWFAIRFHVAKIPQISCNCPIQKLNCRLLLTYLVV